MAVDPQRGRNLAIVIAAGIALGVLAMALLVGNADGLRDAVGR